MEMISNIDRNQLTFSSMDEAIEKNNAVRVIDAFVDHVDLTRNKQ